MKRLGCRETTFFFSFVITYVIRKVKEVQPSFLPLRQQKVILLGQPSFLPKLVYSYSRNAIHGAITENENLSVF